MTLSLRWKPYPEYKPSDVEWLGHVPSEWDVTPLFAIARERQERNYGNQETNVLSLSYGRIIPRDVTTNYGLLPASFETYQITHPGNIVMRLTDLQNDKRSLRVGLVRERGIITSAYLCLDLGKLDPNFGYYLLHAYDVLKVFYAMGAGVRQTMKFEDLKRLPLLIPSPDEQRAIAAFLDRETARIDGLIAKKERLIALLQEQRAALISQAVTRGLDPTVPMKDSGVEWLGEIPAHWEVKRLKHLLQRGLVNGLFKKKEFFGSGVKLINVIDIYQDDCLVDFQTLDRVEISAAESETYKVKAGDIFFVRSSLKLEGVGASATILETPEPAVFECHLVGIRPSQQRILPQYLISYLNSALVRQRLVALAKTTTMTTIDQMQLASIEVFLPPLNEQAMIANHVFHESSQLERMIAKIRDTITRLQEYRTALITAAVTGKIDVRGEGEDNGGAPHNR